MKYYQDKKDNSVKLKEQLFWKLTDYLFRKMDNPLTDMLSSPVYGRWGQIHGKCFAPLYEQLFLQLQDNL